jgi:ribose transport system substrate-binding protein
MKKRLIIFAVLMILVLVLPACQPKDDDSVVVGFSMLTRTHTFYKLMEEGLIDEAGKLGVELIAVDSETDIAKQLDQVQDFIAQKVDAIILTPVDSAGIEPAIKLANEAGIPVFTMDTAASGEGEVVSHVATDNYAGGALDAEYAAVKLDGEGQVAIIGCAGIESIGQRTAGFEDTMEKYPGIEIVTVTDCKCDGAIAADQTADLLVTYPDLKLIFGTGDPFGLGAVQSINAAGSDVLVVSFDGLPEGIEEVKKGGNFLCTVAQDPDKIARTTLQNIVKYLNGEDVEPLVQIEPYVIDINNAP